MDEELKVKNGIRYLIGYQLVWHLAFNSADMQPELSVEIESILREICAMYRYDIIQLKITEDTISIQVSCPYTVAPVDAMKTLKSFSSNALIKKYPQVKKFYVKTGLVWKHGCTITTFVVQTEKQN